MKPVLHILRHDSAPEVMQGVCDSIKAMHIANSEPLTRADTPPPDMEVAVGGARSAFGRRSLFPTEWGSRPLEEGALQQWLVTRIQLGQAEARAGHRPSWLAPDDDEDDDTDDGDDDREAARARQRLLALAARRWGP